MGTTLQGQDLPVQLTAAQYGTMILARSTVTDFLDSTARGSHYNQFCHVSVGN